MFLSLCHHNAAKYFERVDSCLTLPVVVLPLGSSSTVVFQLGTELNTLLSIAVAVLNVFTALLVVVRRHLKTGDRVKNHENMSMFYQECKNDVQAFVKRDHSLNRLLSFEDMVNERLNTLSLMADDIPIRVENATDAEMLNMNQRSQRRKDTLAVLSPVVGAGERSSASSAGSSTSDSTDAGMLRTSRNHVKVSAKNKRKRIRHTRTLRTGTVSTTPTSSEDASAALRESVD
jgi:hypothetical protein